MPTLAPGLLSNHSALLFNPFWTSVSAPSSLPQNMAAATLASGMAFGAALYASGIYRSDLIVAQLRLEDFIMLRIFLTATLSGG